MMEDGQYLQALEELLSSMNWSDAMKEWGKMNKARIALILADNPRISTTTLATLSGFSGNTVRKWRKVIESETMQ
jgi:hypothetical protein